MKVDLSIYINMKIKRYSEWVSEALKPSQFREYVKEFNRDRYKDIFMRFNDEHDDNHQNRCLIIEDGIISKGGEYSLREGSKPSKNIVEQYKNMLSKIKTDQEAESFIQNFYKDS